MIRLEAYVDDNKIAKVLHALDGLVYKLEVHPVRNATMENGQLTGAGHPTSGPDVIKYGIRRALSQGRKTIALAEMQSLAKEFGVSSRSVSSAMHPIVHKFKMLRMLGKGNYTIMVKLPASTLAAIKEGISG